MTYKPVIFSYFFSGHRSRSPSRYEEVNVAKNLQESEASLSEAYRVQFRVPVTEGQALTSKQRKDLYLESTAQVTISIGCSHRHNGPHLRDTLNKVSSEFKSVVVMLDDSVQGHTLALEYPDFTMKILRALGKSAGDQWLTCNQQYIDIINNQFPGKISIVRWSDWDDTEELTSAIEKMNRIYHTNQFNGAIKAGIDETANAFLSRVKQRVTWPSIRKNFTEDQIVEISVKYLIEECAGMAYIWPKLKTNFELYPSERTRAMSMTFDYLIRNEHPRLLNPLMLSFRKKNVVHFQEQNTDESKSIFRR